MKGIQFSLNDFKRHPWLHFLSVTTIAASLLVIGIFLLFFRNFSQAAALAEPKLTGTAYLNDGLTEIDIESLRQKILFMEGVQTAVYRGKRSVLEDLGEFVGAPKMRDLSTKDLFPDVIELTVSRNIENSVLASLTTSLNGMEGVLEVDFSQDVVAQYAKVKRALTIVGSVLLVGLLIGCGFIIANFMGMRHQSKKREIQIISFVGASKSFLLVPFLWESAIEGFLGALCALVGIYATRTFFVYFAPEWLSSFGLESWAFLSAGQMLALFAIGIGMAFVGSITVFFRLKEI